MSQSSVSSLESVLTEESCEGQESLPQYLLPYSLIVKNLPPTRSNAYTALGQHLMNKLDFKVEKVLSVGEGSEESGYAILVFGNTPEDFKAAMQIHMHFDSASRGKTEWEMPVNTSQPFGWLATPKDIDEFRDKAEFYVPCSIPWEWIEQAFASTNADNRNVYCSIRLFAARFAYMKFR